MMMKGLASPLRGAVLPLQWRSTSDLGRPGYGFMKLSRLEATPTLRYCTASAAIPPAPGNQARKIFVDFAVYKGKSAMKMRPSKPLFKLLDNGGAAILKEGTVFMEIAPATSQRIYDWNKKQIFALSVTELGTLINLAPDGGCEFFHDPNMGKSDAGMIRKVFKVEPMTDRSGYFFNLNVSNKVDQFEGRLGVPISKSEFAVMRSTINYIIPHLLGWHVFVDPLKLDDTMLSEDSSFSNPNFVRDAIPEWAK
ncbi:hypothetical protein O6H91_20G027300 [Diphasiastrum complanatum]|uniref:Uncharacterized protein n=2 Tax=Diphasiastrum complanatum TaxID=34168 RepID=A0ACC2ANQ4_DIPCM|nr:hypothetical protein O6H91_Y277600 [Diphasiastrum complanatum]KAJ7519190.1 hypothetical protein O6H91_20G027300 [Diphasiastrum complanatum]